MRLLLTIFILNLSIATFAQTMGKRPLTELINTADPGWNTVQCWIKNAKNKVEVLPKDSKRADEALYEAQVTTRSPMGAIVYETGGILIDGGWIRILGSGSTKLDRTLMGWNETIGVYQSGHQPAALLIADDALGGFFAINNGGIFADKIGKIFYFAPDDLEWTSMEMGYSQFIEWCMVCDIKKFYDGLRWTGWQKEVAKLDGNQAINCFPPLFTKEGKDLNKVSRKAVPILEIWSLYGEKISLE